MQKTQNKQPHSSGSLAPTAERVPEPDLASLVFKHFGAEIHEAFNEATLSISRNRRRPRVKRKRVLP